MPSIVAPNEGLPDLLSYMLSATITGVFPLKLGLFINDIDPDQDTVFADLTEPTWPAYARKSLDRALWTAPVIVDDHAESTYTTAPQVWVNDSSDTDTVYGVFFYDDVAGVLRFVQRFDPGDVREFPPGSKVLYLPRLTLTTEGLV